VKPHVPDRQVLLVYKQYLREVNDSLFWKEPMNTSDDIGRPLEQTIRTYDTIASDYCPKTRLEKYLRWEREYIRKMLDLIDSVEPRVLDVGCGDGRHCRIIDQEGGQAVGIDLSEGMLAEARKLCPDIDFHQMNMLSLAFEDDAFDGLWSSGSIYHVPKSVVLSVLSEFERILRPEGVLAMSFKLGTGEGIEDNPGSYAGLPRYFAYYTLEGMTWLLEEAGFSVVETSMYPEKIFGADNLQLWSRK
jgi:ubiquinone/menaquinone biosynthesis C-methylase UbiE